VWVEGGDIQDELLDRLGGVLAPPEDLVLTPSAEELEALALAVAARWPEGAVAPGPDPAAESLPFGGGEVRRLHWAGPRTRRIGSSAWRAGSVAAGIVLFSASAAAAATGGVPLPRPVRVVAYTVGLPVDSPALDDTHQHIKELKDAVKANDKPKAEATVRRLQTDLRKVPADEKKEAAPKVEAAIVAAQNQGVVQSPAPTTTTSVPTSTTTVNAPASSTTATTAEEPEKEKARSTVTTTTGPTTTTTEPESTTTTTAPETDGTAPGGTTGDPGPGDGHTGAGDGGDPGTTPTTVPQDTTTTTTTAPPPEETTTTTTTAPEPVTTTTTAPPGAP
jgi:hypothetical protein